MTAQEIKTYCLTKPKAYKAFAGVDACTVSEPARVCDISRTTAYKYIGHLRS